MLRNYNSFLRLQVAATRSISIASVSRQDVLSCKDSKWMGQYIKAVCAAPEAEAQSHADNIDEFFRNNFRKLDYRQAVDIFEALYQKDKHSHAAALDGSFWTWEALEIALRGNVNSLSDEEFMAVLKGFSNNYKGSKDLFDELEKRICFEMAELKM